MEPEMKLDYWSLNPWHHLIFVEELADDARDKANCGLCWEQAVGPVYKCLECDFIQHKSCPNPTKRYWKSWMKNHNYDSRHHLTLVEQVENRAEKEVVCSECQEIAFLPAFKCTLPGCTFLLHKSCAELSSLVVLHPQHSDHVLTLQAIELCMGSRGKDKRCNACNKLIECFYYGCRRCNVYLHPKCSAPEMELEVEPLPLQEDLSPWHHLIFVEELAYKDECSLCGEQAVGPVYKCLELGCGFIIHKSCPKPIKRSWEERMKNHYSQQRHHLMLVEEVENRAEEAVVCWGCEEPPSLPAYKCVLPGCTFLLHKSCTEVSHAVLHPLHSDHVLTLQANEENCNACIKHKKSLCYGCRSCDVFLHKKCLPLFQISSPSFHEHKVFLQGMPERFLCEACGEETMGFRHTCNICHLTMERRCCDFPHTIQTTLHGHSLTFTYSVRLINKQDRVFCRLCRKRVNTRYGAYYCVKCGYILHLNCARKYEDKDSSTESVSSSCEEHTIYLFDGSEALEDKRVDEPEKIKHFNHPCHDLILSHGEPRCDKKCEACSYFIFFAPYYSCVECNFFLHVRCAKLPTTVKRGIFHKHPLTLISQVSVLKNPTHCHLCLWFRDGYAYVCDQCNLFKLDVQCALLPEALEHHLHKHILFLVGSYERREICKGCCDWYMAYVCTDGCEFGLCERCVTIPPIAKYRYHPHYLKVAFARDDEDQEDNYCFICEERRHSKELFYWCEDCDFTVHSKCILGSPEDHRHALTFVKTTEETPPCERCELPIKDGYDQTVVGCIQCKYFVHQTCPSRMFHYSS